MTEKEIIEALDKEYQETGTISGIGAPMSHDTIMKLIGEINAEVWAEKFCQLVKIKAVDPADKDTMVGWFVNAIMTRFDLGPFQDRVKTWCLVCFGKEAFNDKTERNHRFIEEALELVQSLGYTREDCHKLVDYVFNRPKGEINQEVGGVMTTLAALCSANNLDMIAAGEKELVRMWTKIEEIKMKQSTKGDI